MRAADGQPATARGVETERLPPRFALLIGIDNYTKGWPRKQNAVRDAKLISSEFLRHGYKVALLENPDSRRLHRALKQFFLVDGDDPRAQLFIWYSGHAHTIEGRTFLVPTDAPLPRREADFTSMSFALDDYTELLRRAPASQVYTVLDAPVAAIDFDTRPDVNSQADRFAVDLPVRQFLASAIAGQAPADDGVFRRLFLRGLAGINRADGNLDKMLTADEIGGYMANRVAALTKNRQTPIFGRLPGREFAGGDFAFRVGTSHRTDMAAQRARDPNGDTEEIERVLWASIEDSADPRKFESFLKIYPDGANAEKAFARLGLVRRAQDNALAALVSPTGPQAEAPAPLPAPQRVAPQPRGAKPAAIVNPFAAPSAPAMPVPKVGAADLGPPPRALQVAQAGPTQPAFEEMAVPDTSSGTPPASQSLQRGAAPLPLTPRFTDTGAALPLKVTPRRAAQPAGPPAVAAPPPPIPASIPSAEPSRPISRPPPEASAAPMGGKIVQLGAFRAREEAEKALANWRSQVPAVFAAATAPTIVLADLGPKGIYYRVRISGFGDSRKAADFCASFRGGGRDCFVVP